MAKDQELLIKINGSAKHFIDEMDKVNRKTKDLQAGLSRVAKVSALAFTALAGAMALAVNEFSKFEKTFTNVQTLLDKSSFSAKSLAEGVNELKKGVLDLGAASGESLQDLNQGLFDIISATGDAENAMGVLQAATNLAIAGGTNVAVAVDGLTTSIKAFGLETSDAQSIAEKFFQAQKGGKTTVEELASSIGLVASTAAAYSVSLDEVLAASSAATLAGQTTKATMTGLKQVFVSISKPTKEAADEAKRLGIEFSSAALRSKGLEEFLGDLTTANGFTKESIEKLFGSVEAQGLVFALAGEQSADFTKQIKLLADEQAAAATFADALAVKQATTERATARMGVAMQSAAVIFGEAFAPAVNAIADALTTLARKFASLDKDTVAALAKLVSFFAAIAGGTTILAVLGIGILKFQGLLAALRVAFSATRVSAAAMWGAVTLGLTAVITFMPELIGLFNKLIGKLEDIEDVNSFDELDKQIELVTSKLKAAQQQAELFDPFNIAKNSADELQEKLDALLAKRQALEEAEKKIAEEKAAREQAEKDRKAEEAAKAEEDKTKKIDAAKTDAELLEEIEKEKAANEEQGRKQYLQDEKKHGKGLAELNQALSSDTVNLAKEESGKLVALTQSKNKQVQDIGKAASIVQIGIKTAEGAISAYSALSGIPIVGPALGAVAAAGVIAYGAEQARAVTSAKDGGIVPAGGSGSRDRIPALLEPGELVVPKALAPNFIQSVGRGDGGGSSGGSMEVIIGFKDDAFDIIEENLLERRAIGTGNL